MTATLVEPLRKKNNKGKLYTRSPEIEAKLVELLSLGRAALAERCAVKEKEDPAYVPSECLVHLFRQQRSAAMDEYSEALFKTLMERVLKVLPNADSQDGERENLKKGNVRDRARHRFLEMLIKDRQEYVEGLDIYEVRFAQPLRALRLDARKYVLPRENPLVAIEHDTENGEICVEVEHAARGYKPFDRNAMADLDYRLDLEQAIDALPDLQKAIVAMIEKGIPIESQEPGELNIAESLGKTPKTIRTHRDKAYATLRAALTKGEQK